MNGTPPPPISFGCPSAQSPSALARDLSRRIESAASPRARTGSAGMTSSSMKRGRRSRSERTSGERSGVDIGVPPALPYTAAGGPPDTVVASGARRFPEGAARGAGHDRRDDDRRREAEPEDSPVPGASLHGCPAGERRDVAGELAVVDVQQRARDHPDGGEEIVHEADPCQPEEVVEEREREDRREAKEEHDLPSLDGHRAVDGGEARIPGDQALDRPPRQVTRDEESRAGSEDRRDEDVDHALRQAEDRPGGERQDRAGDERHHRDRVAEDEDERSPHAEPVHPRGEAGDLAAGETPDDDERRDGGARERDARQRHARRSQRSSSTGLRLSEVRPW